jgi:hypothetical protein
MAEITKTGAGYIVSVGGARLAGPFREWVHALVWRDEHQELVARAEHQSRNAADAEILRRAMEGRFTGKPGRPAPDQPRAVRVALEYYWRRRRRKRYGSDTRIIAGIAQDFGCSTDYVRKCRKEYDAPADYGDDLLNQLRAQPAAAPKSANGPRRASKLEDAGEWLYTLLKAGPRATTDIYRRAQVADYSERTIDEAKKRLKVRSARNGRIWVWTLPRVQKG